MKVYAFAEFYPNPFKPYVDAQFAQTLDDGHDLSVFAFGTWGDPGSRVIADRQLASRTTYIPAAPRQVSRFVAASAMGALTRGGRMLRAARAGPGRLRSRIVRAVQAALLPLPAPDLCFIHDLGTAVRVTVLRSIYPTARVALYYHGGETARGVVRDDATARAGFALADTVFTNTAFSRDEAVRRGCPPDRIRVLPVGFDIRQFPMRSDPASHDGGLRLVVVGRLGQDKGVEYAIDAVQIVTAAGVPVECIIIGDGDERQVLERRAQDAGVGRQVRFVGTLPHHEVIEKLAAADAVLLPSVPTATWTENQACVLQEAMLAGALLVATRAGGVPESVPSDMHEFLVPPRDAAAMAAAIRRLAAMTPDQWSARRSANRAFCERRYDVETLNRRMLAEAMGAPGEQRDI